MTKLVNFNNCVKLANFNNCVKLVNFNNCVKLVNFNNCVKCNADVADRESLNPSANMCHTLFYTYARSILVNCHDLHSWKQTNKCFSINVFKLEIKQDYISVECIHIQYVLFRRRTTYEIILYFLRHRFTNYRTFNIKERVGGYFFISSKNACLTAYWNSKYSEMYHKCS